MPLQDRIELPGEQSIALELYVHLRAAILSGQLRPYERLVESTMARIANVSRTPVREALHRLETIGLVRDNGRGGVEVCGFSLDELAELCAVRETLEGMATGLAASSPSLIDHAILERIIAAEAEALDAGASAAIKVSLNHAFHETLWHASGNRYLSSELQQLRGLIERLQTTTLQTDERFAEALCEHRAIVGAVARRDADAASELARHHFRNAMTTRLVMAAGQGAADGFAPKT